VASSAGPWSNTNVVKHVRSSKDPYGVVLVFKVCRGSHKAVCAGTGRVQREVAVHGTAQCNNGSVSKTHSNTTAAVSLFLTAACNLDSGTSRKAIYAVTLS
jgi:hypothetical protein